MPSATFAAAGHIRIKRTIANSRVAPALPIVFTLSASLPSFLLSSLAASAVGETAKQAKVNAMKSEAHIEGPSGLVSRSLRGRSTKVC